MMRWLPTIALLMGLSGGAQAFTLFETEPNDCFCEATPGGTAQTTAISGFLSDFEEDYYRFDFTEAVSFFSVRPASPDIEQDYTYRVFDLALFQGVMEGAEEIIDLVAICKDCWFNAGAVEAYNLPAGTYYVGVADFGGDIAFIEEPPQDAPRALGEYTLSVSTAVPEPASLALLGTALAGTALAGTALSGLATRRRRRA